MSSENSLTEISKFLALVLRHKPDEAGITLDKHGWARTDELVEGIASKCEFSLSILEQIVATDAKNRYSFNDDHTYIRANQGHSVPVDVELLRCVPPDELYHGTADRFLSSILEEGLVPQDRLYVHLSKNRGTARNVGARHGKPVVLAIDARAMHEEGIAFYLSENNVWLAKSVPPRYIKVLPQR